jgi:hypothetical protein
MMRSSATGSAPVPCGAGVSSETSAYEKDACQCAFQTGGGHPGMCQEHSSQRMWAFLSVSFCLSVCLFLSVCLSKCVSFRLSDCLSVCLSVCLCLSLCQPSCLSDCLSVCLSGGRGNGHVRRDAMKKCSPAFTYHSRRLLHRLLCRPALPGCI